MRGVSAIDYPLIDADGHYYEPDDCFSRHIEARYRGATVRVERRGDGLGRVFVGDRLFDDIWGAEQVGMRTILVPHSVIPTEQLGHTEGRPDAVVRRLSEIYDVVSAWT